MITLYRRAALFARQEEKLLTGYYGFQQSGRTGLMERQEWNFLALTFPHSANLACENKCGAYEGKPSRCKQVCMMLTDFHWLASTTEQHINGFSSSLRGV